MSGIHGRYLRIDLSRGTSEHVVIPASVSRRLLGGVGLGTWLLLRESTPGFDPLSAEAPLVFAFSPLVGTGLTTSAKFAVVAKSPLTGFVCDALASSHFAIAGKRMGIDAIVVKGACETPSEWVGGVLRPTASWGRSAAETGSALGGEGRVAAIGVAGEHLVRFATISADGRHAGRGGLGAVMGAKRLKAIVVAGEFETPIADRTALEARADRLRARAAGPETAKYRELGTVGNLLAFDRVGALPTRNFQTSHFEGAEKLAAERWRGERAHRRAACAHCTIGCEQRYASRPGGAADVRIEYESQFALGPLVGVADPDAVLAASARCDALGLDTISAGATLAFAMECGERGWLEGAPGFGDDLLPWLDRIATRDGLGDRLAEGSLRLAREIGDEAVGIAPQVKGLEMPGYEPRALQTMALGLAVSSRGADHNRSSAYEADFSEEVDRMHGDARSVAAAVAAEERAAILDSLVLCKFVRGAMGDLFEESAAILSDLTGEAWSADGVETVAKRIVDLRRLGNEREGWQPADDSLPKRFLEEPIPGGPAVGARLPAERLRELIRSYYLERGYDESGRVSSDRRMAFESELGLDLTGPASGGADDA